jgi:hypothetical protein
MDAQTRILNEQNRAVINFDAYKIISVDTGRYGPGKVVGLSFNVVNNGNVSTKRFRALAICKRALPGEAKNEPFDFFRWEEDKAVPDVVGPKQQKAVSDCSFTPDEIRKIAAFELIVYLLAEVRYQDRLDPSKTRRTRMSEQLAISHVSEDKDGVIHFYSSSQNVGRNNCADEDCPQ